MQKNVLGCGGGKERCGKRSGGDVGKCRGKCVRVFHSKKCRERCGREYGMSVEGVGKSVLVCEGGEKRCGKCMRGEEKCRNRCERVWRVLGKC